MDAHQQDALPTSHNLPNTTGADAILQSLLRNQVTHVFGYPGGAIMPVYDSLYDFSEHITHYLTRHEQGAIHAAEGYARSCEKPGVVFATSGPGATNLITGLADAQMDSVPVVCIVGQVAAKLLGTDAFQETNFMSVCAPITKWSYQVTNPDEVAEVMDRAFYLASEGRPGPVVIEITKDAQLAHQNVLHTSHEQSHQRVVRQYTPDTLQAVAQLLNQSKQPLLLCGNGVSISGAEDALLRFVEKSQIPVACTLHGLSAFPKKHELYVGMLGMHGNVAPNVLTNQADVLVAVGMRFDDRVTGNLNQYAKQATIVHIDIDSLEIGKLVHATYGVVGDAKEILEELTILVEQSSRQEWLQRFREIDQKEEIKVRKACCFPESGDLTMPEVITLIGKQIEEEAIVLADVGQHQMMVARYFPFNRKKGFISSGGLGTMGFALPAAIGAQIANPGTLVVSFSGDGGYQMTIQELATIRQYQLPLKIVVLNNNFLGMVRQWQELFHGKRYSFVELDNPDLTKVTAAFDIPSFIVSERTELLSTVNDWLNTSGPAFLNVIVKNEENVFPMMPTGAAVHEIRME